MVLGDIIRQYCADQKISYRKFAEQCGLTSGYISMLVNNRNPKTGKPPVLSINTYQRIAKAMNLTVPELLEKTESDTPSFVHHVSTEQAQKLSAQADQSYRGLADAIVERLRETDGFGVMDDEIMELRQAMKDNPQLRVLWSLQRRATKDQLQRIEDFAKGVIGDGQYDETDTP